MTLVFQPTRPLRGATIGKEPLRVFIVFQPTRPLRGATTATNPSQIYRYHFNPRAPCGARQPVTKLNVRQENFNPRAPCGARHELTHPSNHRGEISTHAPLAGRDGHESFYRNPWSEFQPTRPLRGATRIRYSKSRNRKHFNPRAPCGARQQKCTNHYAHFCDNRQISDAFAQNAACQGILLLFDAGKPCGFWVRTAQVISAHLCFAL